MRLIDADALLQNCKDNITDIFKDDDERAAVFGFCSLITETSYTIEAIPIEWLITWKKDNDYHSRSSSQIVNKIIKDWREEQGDDKRRVSEHHQGHGSRQDL